MSEIVLTDAQKKALAIDELEEKKKLDHDLAVWVYERGWAIVPVMRYTDRGIHTGIDFVKLTDEQKEEVKKRL